MYFGLYTSTVRAKNRIAFPARLKKETGDTLFITNWFENSLLILPKKEWEEKISSVFEKTSFLMPEVRDLDRFIFGGTFTVELDHEGRFILPGYLKEFAKIRKKAVFIGGMWYIQMWDEQVFESYRELNLIQVKDKTAKIFETLKR